VVLAVIDQVDGFLDPAPIDRQLHRAALHPVGILYAYLVSGRSESVLDRELLPRFGDAWFDEQSLAALLKSENGLQPCAVHPAR
jgi:hypothetical protein